jgi:4a-hydroxytetrahydrobiopterin dehydratase
MEDLLKKVCISCEGRGIKPFGLSEIEKYMPQVPGWALSSDEDPASGLVNARIFKEYKFKDFTGAMNFVDKVAKIAESEGHHPDIHINYNKVLLELTTHAIGGLSENDFIVAAKVDAK